MYFGNYNIYTSIASHKNKKIVCPINVDYAESIFPYWSNSENCKLIQSNPNNLKPSLLTQEPAKTINDVKPEILSAQILDFLNIKHNLNKIETIYMGKNYTKPLTEIIPFVGFDPNTQIGQEVVVRLDKATNTNSLHVSASLEFHYRF